MSLLCCQFCVCILPASHAGGVFFSGEGEKYWRKLFCHRSHSGLRLVLGLASWLGKLRVLMYTFGRRGKGSGCFGSEAMLKPLLLPAISLTISRRRSQDWLLVGLQMFRLVLAWSSTVLPPLESAMHAWALSASCCSCWTQGANLS